DHTDDTDTEQFKADVTDQLRALLPDYMVPSTLALVDEIPLSANGKVDRKQAQILLAEHADAQQTILTPPEGDKECQVASVWQALLPDRSIGRESHFFSLGGDSLLATQVISTLRENGLTAEQPLRLLFAQPVLAEFAAGLSFENAEPLSTLVPDPDARFEPFPLTEVQRAYWMGQSPGLPLNCGTHYLVELDGENVNIGRLEQAWNSLVQHHDMLRVDINDMETQCVAEDPSRFFTSIEQVECDDLEHASTQLSLWWKALSSSKEATLFAARVFSMGHHRSRVGLIFNYLTLDGFSIKMLLRQLALRYRDLEAPLPAPAVSFRDYVQQFAPSAKQRETAIKYWEQKLETLPLSAALPLKVDPRTVNHSHFRRRSMILNRETWQSLKKSTRANGITPSVAVLSAFCEVLSRWSGGHSHTVNMTLFDRQPIHPDINHVAGDFTSLVPVGYQPDRSANLIESALQLQEETFDALEHRQVSSIYVQRERAKHMDMTAAALPIVFTSTLGMSDDLLREETISEFPQISGGGLSETPQVWLDHQMYEYGDELHISWDTVDSLFPEGMLDDMFDALGTMLNTLNVSWNSPLDTLLPLQQTQTRRVTNTTEYPYKERTLHQPFFEMAAETPERTAIISEQHSLSYGELAQAALQLAALLTEHGVQPGEPVAVTLPRGHNQVIAVLGILAAGGCYVPVGTHQPLV
ncbi:condensation domain-containing protein, partial [Grimontia marina]|uniref:condensation domain-containing protein n=1 Tax=Grimontia marina TaxID=646534 RepID=UPI000AF13605